MVANRHQHTAGDAERAADATAPNTRVVYTLEKFELSSGDEFYGAMTGAGQPNGYPASSGVYTSRVDAVREVLLLVAAPKIARVLKLHTADVQRVIAARATIDALAAQWPHGTVRPDEALAKENLFMRHGKGKYGHGYEISNHALMKSNPDGSAKADALATYKKIGDAARIIDGLAAASGDRAAYAGLAEHVRAADGDAVARAERIIAAHVEQYRAYIIEHNGMRLGSRDFELKAVISDEALPR
jgi:hypothetical protein